MRDERTPRRNPGRKRVWGDIGQSLREPGQRERLLRTAASLLIAAYGLGAAYLYRCQLLWTGGAVYESDLPAHIRMAVEDGWYYSLTAFAYRFFYRFPFGDALTVLFLAVSTLLSVYLAALLFRELRTGARTRIRDLGGADLLAGLALNLVMPCYVRGVADGRYIGMQSASIWHNSTYLVMKWLALLAVIWYVRIERGLRGGLRGRECLAFLLALTAATAVKPSFLTVFAPAMLVYLIVDLLRGVPLMRLFCLGCTVLPSLAVVWIQNAVLFGGDTGSGFEFHPGAVLAQHSAHPLIAAGLSALFPAGMLALWTAERLWGHRPERTGGPERRELGRAMGMAWTIAAFGFLEYACFREEGQRALDGNFLWGYNFALLLVFLTGLVEWGELARRAFAARGDAGGTDRAAGTGSGGRTGSGVDGAAKRLAVWLAGAAFVWHLYCGIVFYVRLLQGVSYFMWD